MNDPCDGRYEEYDSLSKLRELICIAGQFPLSRRRRVSDPNVKECWDEVRRGFKLKYRSRGYHPSRNGDRLRLIIVMGVP